MGENVSSVTTRLIMVFEAVLEHGPVTLAELDTKLPITQSGIFRAVKSLENFGWVQKSLGSGGFVATLKIHGSVALGRFGFPNINSMRKIIRKCHLGNSHHVDLFVLRRDGTCVLADSTEHNAERLSEISLITHPGGHAVLTIMAPVSRTQMIARKMETATDAEKLFVREGGLKTCLEVDPNWGVLFNTDHTAATLGVSGTPAFFGAMHIRPKINPAPKTKTLLKRLDAMHAFIKTETVTDIKFPTLKAGIDK